MTGGALTGPAAQAGDDSDNQVLVDFYLLDKSGKPVRPSREDGLEVIHRTSEKDAEDVRWSEVLLDPGTLEAIPGKAGRVEVTDDGAGHLRLAFTARKLPSGKGPALAVAWPTGKGYSYVVMDNGGQGYAQTPDKPVVFNYQAAKDIEGQLRARVAGVPGYQPPEVYTDAFARAVRELRKVGDSSPADDQGRVGERALTDLHTAYDAFLADYGPRLAQRRMATARHGQDARPWLGATIVESETVPFYDKVWPRIAKATTPTGRQSGYGWVRIVFEYDEKHGNKTTVDFEQYDRAIRNAHQAGLRVMGEVLDSTAAAQLTTEQYTERTRNLLKHYGRSAGPGLRIDAWEVGNEVNGCWVDNKEKDINKEKIDCAEPVSPGDRIHVKAGAAARAVKQDSPTTPVALTLFWELGAWGPSTRIQGGTPAEQTPWAYSPFNWIAPGSGNLQWTDRESDKHDLLDDADVVLLSIYADNAPLGISLDRVMSTLDRRVSELSGKPGQHMRVGIGELGYWCGHDEHSDENDPVYEWCKDMNRVWPLGNTGTDNASLEKDRAYMVDQYTRAALATDHGLGGGFHWYALQEMFPQNTTTSLCAALKAVTDAIGPQLDNQSNTATPRQPC
ncbi:hypothetical protein JOF56_009965 [Kibdelosporangium banguiense]|uniref:Uncharacterized protein n=1 Tax=Kibdelosporangium banguiense TaxID=1365924 RepID=A0ABS4TYW0_9PSEU|nr:hypothetical protein [Kibdelosporangium banguiense]